MSKYDLIGKIITDGTIYLAIKDYNDLKQCWICEDIETGEEYTTIETSDLLGFSVV